MDRNRINEDLELISSIDNFSGTPIKRKIYDSKCWHLTEIDVSDEIISFDEDIIDTIETISKNTFKLRTKHHLLEVDLSCDGTYFNYAGILCSETINAILGEKVLKCYVTDGYDLHRFYSTEIEQNIKGERSECFPELYKLVVETERQSVDILFYNSYNDWFGNERANIEVILDGAVITAFSI